MMTVAASSHSSLERTTGGWNSQRSTWRRLARVVWLQHRAGFLGFLVVFLAFVVAIVVEESGVSGDYATFVAAGCAAHQQMSLACNADAGALGWVEFRAIGTALCLLPLLVAVFLGAPLVARELESGTFRFAWTQGLSRSRLVLATLGLLAVGATTIGVLLGLIYGGWYAHIYDVVLPPIVTQWQTTLFALGIGALLGTVIRRIVPAMAATAAVVGGLIAGMYVLLPQLLHFGASVRRLTAPVGTMVIGPINTPIQQGWDVPEGSWVVHSWLTGPNAHVLDAQAVQRVAYELSSRTNAGAARWLALHHDTFWVSYQPPGHFWLAQGVEGVVVLALAALCTGITVRCLRGRVGV
jgi:hypothetical protein